MKALVGAFNQEKALVGAFSVIVQLHRLIDLRHCTIHTRQAQHINGFTEYKRDGNVCDDNLNCVPLEDLFRHSQHHPRHLVRSLNMGDLEIMVFDDRNI